MESLDYFSLLCVHQRTWISYYNETHHNVTIKQKQNPHMACIQLEKNCNRNTTVTHNREAVELRSHSFFFHFFFQFRNC